MAKKVTVDLSGPLTNLKGEPINTQRTVLPNRQIVEEPAPNMAEQLADMCIVHKEAKSPMKLIIFGESLYTTGTVDVDEADISTLKEVLDNNAQNNLVKARIGQVLDAALAELKNPEKKE